MATLKRKYTNDELTVFWQPDYCAHAGVCFHELPRVFDPRRRPWIDLSQGDTKSIVELINRCPTKALTFRWRDEKRNESEASHKLLKNEDDTSEVREENRPLCGCGRSKNKPYCDGSHLEI